mgnify:FL=1
MRHLSILVAMLLCVANNVTADDSLLSRAYLSETMKWLPKDCLGAKEALENFDHEADDLQKRDQKFVEQFVQEYRWVMLDRVKMLCQSKNA